MPVTGPNAKENMMHPGNYRQFGVWRYLKDGLTARGWRVARKKSRMF